MADFSSNSCFDPILCGEDMDGIRFECKTGGSLITSLSTDKALDPDHLEWAPVDAPTKYNRADLDNE